MNYDTAKKLKDAGYSQKWKSGIFESKEVGGQNDVRMIETVYIPTLSELIEACGKDFKGLIPAPHLSNNSGVKTFVGDEEVNWRADSKNSFALGKTPEEAVANLWLKLNHS